jgi:aminopeptidase N
MNYLIRGTFLLLLLTCLNSCAVIGFNKSRKTPHRPGSYPEFTEKDSLRGQLTRFRSAYDVTFYDLNVDLDIENRYLKGSVDIGFAVTEDMDTMQIDLYENMKVERIMHDGDTLLFYRKYNAVFIRFDEMMHKGEKHTLTVYYEGKPKVAPRPPWEGGFVWKKDRDRNPWIGVACEIAGASLWWPVKDHISDEPDSMRISVTIPGGLFCVSNGKLIARSEQNGRETFVWETHYPINTYNATLYVGNFRHFTLAPPREDTLLPMDFYVLPYHLEKAMTHFMQAGDILNFYESVFGEYPFKEEGYKLVESPYEGMEHQTAIAYGDKYRNLFRGGFDYIILHETAHEWWGNSVSIGDYAEIWLHEGFATYCEALYVEHVYGHEAYRRYLSFYAMLIRNKRPIIGPYDVNYWNYKDTDVYMKGALILHTLRNLIHNDPLFFDIMHTFYETYKYSIASTKDFIHIVNEKTGCDLTWFFNQYLYSRVCPCLEWHLVRSRMTGQNEFRYRWNNLSADFHLPVRIQYGKQKSILYPSRSVQTIMINTDGDVSINTDDSYISLKKNKSL